MRDFTTVTEVPGEPVSRQAIEMAVARYRFAADRSAGKRVLEVACGPGVGLGLLAAQASRVVGGDFTASLARQARAHYGSRLPVVRLDAQDLPFSSGSFDVVIMFEAVYFIPDARRAFASIARTLVPGGQFIVCTVSPTRPGFIQAPGSTRYFDARTLEAELAGLGFATEIFGAFPIGSPGPIGRALVAARTVLTTLGIMPKTMRGKRLLKRLVFGRLVPFPDEIQTGATVSEAPLPLASAHQADQYVIYFIVATKPNREEP